MPYNTREKMYASQEKHRNKNHENLWNLLKISKCLDCKIDDPRVLEFDHRPNEFKKFDISRAISGSTRSWKLIQ